VSRLQEDLDDCLADLLREAGETATLTRGGSSSSLAVIPAARSEHPLNFQTRDFLLPAATYAIGGTAVLPAPGDTLTLAGNVWEVRPFENEVPFNPIQGADSLPWHRVHVKSISWRRHTLRVTQKKQAPGPGQAREVTDREWSVTGIAKAVGGAETFDNFQRSASLSFMAIVPVTTETKQLRPMDEFQLTESGTCRKLQVLSVRDPGTNGSVLYLDCDVRVTP
jgi:hypothetical protein